MLHTFIHENLVQLMKNFRYDAHPMGMLVRYTSSLVSPFFSLSSFFLLISQYVSSISAMSTFYPEANPALSVSIIPLPLKLFAKY